MNEQDFIFLMYVVGMFAVVIVAKVLLTAGFTLHAAFHGQPVLEAMKSSWNEVI